MQTCIVIQISYSLHFFTVAPWTKEKELVGTPKPVARNTLTNNYQTPKESPPTRLNKGKRNTPKQSK